MVIPLLANQDLTPMLLRPLGTADKFFIIELQLILSESLSIYCNRVALGYNITYNCLIPVDNECKEIFFNRI